MYLILICTALAIAQDDPPDSIDLMEKRLTELEAAMDRRADLLEQFRRLILKDDTGADTGDTGSPKESEPEPKLESTRASL